jgi:RimJ/RimL family protein N-acetyltransferase
MFEFQPELTGELVAMRPMTPGDWAPLYDVARDPKVWELHPASDRHEERVFRAFFEDGLASGGALVAINRADGAVAGSSRYSATYVEPGEIEIGWTFLGRRYWGGDHNRDMKRIMLTHAFRFVDRVILRIGETNLRSRRAAEKIGARLTDRRQVTGEGEAAQVNLFYAIEKADFADGRAF